jgi:hypothetical protein
VLFLHRELSFRNGTGAPAFIRGERLWAENEMESYPER